MGKWTNSGAYTLAVLKYDNNGTLYIVESGGNRILSLHMKPGIATLLNLISLTDVSLAMQEGWSTAPDVAREMGFGAGMGLPNIKKCADVFIVDFYIFCQFRACFYQCPEIVTIPMFVARV